MSFMEKYTKQPMDNKTRWQILHHVRTDLACTLIPNSVSLIKQIEKDESFFDKKTLLIKFKDAIMQFDALRHEFWSTSKDIQSIQKNIQYIESFMSKEILPIYEELNNIDFSNNDCDSYRQLTRSDIIKYKILLSLFNIVYKQKKEDIKSKIDKSTLFIENKNNLPISKILDKHSRYKLEKKSSNINVDYNSIVNICFDKKWAHPDLLTEILRSIIDFWEGYCEELSIKTEKGNLFIWYTMYYANHNRYSDNQPFELLYLIKQLIDSDENTKITTYTDNKKGNIVFVHNNSQ